MNQKITKTTLIVVAVILVVAAGGVWWVIKEFAWALGVQPEPYHPQLVGTAIGIKLELPPGFSIVREKGNGIEEEGEGIYSIYDNSTTSAFATIYSFKESSSDLSAIIKRYVSPGWDGKMSETILDGKRALAVDNTGCACYRGIYSLHNGFLYEIIDWRENNNYLDTILPAIHFTK